MQITFSTFNAVRKPFQRVQCDAKNMQFTQYSRIALNFRMWDRKIFNGWSTTWFFEINTRLLRGRKLVKIGSRLDFFSLGKMMTRLPGGREIIRGERFVSDFRKGARIGRENLTKDVGIGSRLQDILGGEDTRETIYFSDNSLKWWKGC